MICVCRAEERREREILTVEKHELELLIWCFSFSLSSYRQPLANEYTSVFVLCVCVSCPCYYLTSHRWCNLQYDNENEYRVFVLYLYRLSYTKSDIPDENVNACMQLSVLTTTTTTMPIPTKPIHIKKRF